MRQATDHLQSTIRSVDSGKLIETILGDIHQGADQSWRNCLMQVANRASVAYSSDDVSYRTPSPSPSTFTWPATVEGLFYAFELIKF